MNMFTSGYVNLDTDAHTREETATYVMVRGKRVDVPAGYKLAKGQVRIGDKYLCFKAFLMGEIRFDSADRFVGSKSLGPPEDRAADGFVMLIRPIHFNRG